MKMNGGGARTVGWRLGSVLQRGAGAARGAGGARGQRSRGSERFKGLRTRSSTGGLFTFYIFTPAAHMGI